jgi:hypothetical protein
VMVLQQENGVNETNYTVENPTCLPGATNYITACGATAATQQTYSAAANLRTPYIIQEAIGADQQVGRAGTISINYLHSEGSHELASQNAGYNFTTPAASLPRYQYFSEGVFHQNQLIVNGHVQTSKRVSLFGYYSVNSALGDSSGAGTFITTPGNIAADYGRTAFDVRQRLFMAGSITLPKFIQVSPFMIAQSGQPYNITTGSDNNLDTIFNDRAVLANGATPNGTTIKSIAGCGTFAQPGAATGTTTPSNYCTGPARFSLNMRISKTIGFGGAKVATPSGQGGQGGPGGGGPPGSHGSGSHSGGSHGGGPGGGMYGGGGASTGQRFNLSFGVDIHNVFGNEDLGTPQGALSSPEFGKSTQLSGGPYTSDSALRRISLQTSFTF